MSQTRARVAVIGAGFGGVAAAVRLTRSGADVTVFERAARVGGVWRENVYPGSACDVPSFLYSFSFAPKHDWSRRFAPQGEILDYIDATVDRFGLRDRIEFGQELESAAWDEQTQTWNLRFVGGRTHVADILVTACGQMSTPLIPDLPGAGDFRGRAFHTASWPEGVDVSGLDVVVVGTGASVIQVVPAIAPTAASVTVIQRSPGYVLEKGDHAYAGPQSRWLSRLKRYQSYWSKELRTPRFTRWPALTAPAERSFRRRLRELVPEDELHSKVSPSDRFGCKRILVSNDWYATLRSPHVSLVDSTAGRIVSDGVVTANGEHVRADVIVYGTGFTTTSFLHGVEVTGTGGLRLHDAWAEVPAAYLGLTVPGFPNFFIMYGPNTNPAWNSVLFMLECQVHYIGRFVRRWARVPAAMSVRPEVAATFAADIRRRSARSIWMTGCRNWFVTATGLNTQNWPALASSYWLRTRRVRWGHFERTARRTEPAPAMAASEG